MDETIAQEILHELFSSLEALETRSAALLQFAKDRGWASDQELAPYLEQAGNASNVRWRAARVRIDHLLSSAFQAADRDAKPKSPKPEEKSQESSGSTVAEMSHPEENKTHRDAQDAQKKSAGAKPPANDVAPSAEKNPNQQANRYKNKKDTDTTGNAGESAA
jgi:hypothetical protein